MAEAADKKELAVVAGKGLVSVVAVWVDTFACTSFHRLGYIDRSWDCVVIRVDRRREERWEQDHR